MTKSVSSTKFRNIYSKAAVRIGEWTVLLTGEYQQRGLYQAEDEACFEFASGVIVAFTTPVRR